MSLGDETALVRSRVAKIISDEPRPSPLDPSPIPDPPSGPRGGGAAPSPKGRSTAPVAQIGVSPDPVVDSGGIPCSGGLADVSAPSPFRRRALIVVIVARAASRRASLAGRRQGLVPMRNGQEGHWTTGQTETSFACPTQQSRQRHRRACSGDRGSWPEALSSSCVISRGRGQQNGRRAV
jgi:hypothetical protein